MGVFRRVEGERAGPTALGILIPPARRTFVILRPRALAWDLLLCRFLDDPTALQLTHDEATAVAQTLFRALRDWSAGGEGSLDTVFRQPPDSGCWLRLSLAGFTFVVCPRRPGQAYTPLICQENPLALLDQLREVFCPAEGAEQEIYFNTRFFDRQDGNSQG